MATTIKTTLRNNCHFLWLPTVIAAYFFSWHINPSYAEALDAAVGSELSNKTAWTGDEKNDHCESGQLCSPGILLPVWEPTVNITALVRAGRASVYFLSLIYLFLGVSIIADRFMAAIEVITSQEREVTITRPTGEVVTVSVRMWNETVSNLTLMALGSSAPEILLSVIEVCGHGFESGELGPGTIVGSAAFNLFVIIGFCIAVIPTGQVRRIKHLRVFIITASWSLFAYLWLYFIISISSEGVIDVWEGVITFLFFPATVVTAYIADKKIFVGRFLNRKYRARLSGAPVGVDGVENLEIGVNDLVMSEEDKLKEFERTRKEYIEILRDMRKRHPDVDMKTLEQMSAAEVMNRGPKSRAFYRIQATRKLTGGGNIIKKKAERVDDMIGTKQVVQDDENINRIFFDPGHYTVMENVGSVKLTVTRQGGDLSTSVAVDYRSQDGTASAGTDYDLVAGTIIFLPGETQQQFSVNIIDDDVFEEDEHFFVVLSNVRVNDAGSGDEVKGGGSPRAQLVSPSTATVMILDDDHAGIFHFNAKEETVPESIGETMIRVTRSSGARGSVHVPYRTVEGTAKGGGKDYVDVDGELIFRNDQTEAFVRVKIVNKEEYEKQMAFTIELSEPFSVDPDTDDRIKLPDESDMSLLTPEELVAILGKPRLGEFQTLTVNISESVEFKGVVDKLLKKANMSLVVGTSSWREQFIDAVSVSAGGDDEEDTAGEVKKPSCGDYVMHVLSFFWKVLFAFVPPTDLFGGWAAFTVSIMIIGLLTAIIGDVASHFGCTVGLKDAVTALSFVAMGTSIPDTFASKVAALHDEYADSSVGNVTGSNAVNVFLGIGIAWSIAAIYHAVNGSQFKVEAGSLGFSVTIFCCCSIVCIIIMLLRRLKPISGELGGPGPAKYATACVFFSLWIFYVIMSSLETYCHIKGF